MLPSEFSEIIEINKGNYLQKTSFPKMFNTIRVPAYEFQFNLVVYPLQGSMKNVSKLN